MFQPPPFDLPHANQALINLDCFAEELPSSCPSGPRHMSSASRGTDRQLVSYSRALRENTEKWLHDVSRYVSGLSEINKTERWRAVYEAIHFRLHSLEHVVACMLEEQTSGTVLSSLYWDHVGFPSDLLEVVFSIQKYLSPKGVTRPLGLRLVNLWKAFDQGYSRRFSRAVDPLKKYHARHPYPNSPRFDEAIHLEVRDLWRGFSQEAVNSLTTLVTNLQSSHEAFMPDTGRFYAERINTHFLRWVHLSGEMAKIEERNKSEVLDHEEDEIYKRSRGMLHRSLPEIMDVLLFMAERAQTPGDILFQDFWNHLNGLPKIQIPKLVDLIVRYLRRKGGNHRI